MPPLRHVPRVVHPFRHALVAGIRGCGKCLIPATACGPSYDHVADVSKFAGVENLAEGRNEVIIFSGEYFHCGQSMQ